MGEPIKIKQKIYIYIYLKHLKIWREAKLTILNWCTGILGTVF